MSATDRPCPDAPFAQWTFERRGERIVVLRDGDNRGGFRLVLRGAGGVRSFPFADLNALVQFQQDMETFLVRTGWSLTAFSPDRRSGRDRRGLPRADTDRRRWWTDVLLR